MSQFISSIVEWISANRECFSMTIDIIGTIATVAAVIVAIVANYKANQSIKYSLKIQEQSKNIDLFEKRIAIINEIQENDTTDLISLELLYQEDKEIIESYGQLQKLVQIKKSLEYNLNIFEVMSGISNCKDGYFSEASNLSKLEEAKIAKFQELLNNIEKSKQEIQAQKKSLLELMKIFIQKSIASIKN